jgi:pimeloyl-ACP methyl ester carboxylesterase
MRAFRLLLLAPLFVIVSCRFSSREVPEAVDGSFLGADGTRINYIVQGAGEPVILIHGYTVDSDWNWRVPGILDSIARDFRAIAMDVRGHGKSAKPHSRDAYGRNVLDDIGRLMDHLMIQNAHLVGYSMGGEITLAFVLAFPERVRKAVVGGAGWMATGDSKYELWQTRASLLEAIPPGVSVSEHLFPGADLDESTRRTMDTNDPAALSAVASGMLRLALDEQALRDNLVPTMLVIGEHDQFKLSADKALQVGSRMEMTVLPGQDHLSAIADPEFARAVLAFLRR